MKSRPPGLKSIISYALKRAFFMRKFRTGDEGGDFFNAKSPIIYLHLVNCAFSHNLIRIGPSSLLIRSDLIIPKLLVVNTLYKAYLFLLDHVLK